MTFGEDYRMTIGGELVGDRKDRVAPRCTIFDPGRAGGAPRHLTCRRFPEGVDAFVHFRTRIELSGGSTEPAFGEVGGQLFYLRDMIQATGQLLDFARSYPAGRDLADESFDIAALMDMLGEGIAQIGWQWTAVQCSRVASKRRQHGWL